MKTRNRLGGGSLALRLGAIALVPMIAVGVLAVNRIQLEQNLANEAESLIRQVKIQESVAAIYAPANLERIALTGLAYIDAAGVNRNLVAELTSIEIEQAYADNRGALDDTLFHLAAEHPNLTLQDGSVVSQRVDELFGLIDEQRTLSHQMLATPRGIDDVYEELDTLLSDALNITRSSLLNDSQRIANPRQLVGLADLLSSSGELSQALVFGLMSNGLTSDSPVVAASAVHTIHVHRFTALLTDDEASEFGQVSSILLPPPTMSVEDMVEAMENADGRATNVPVGGPATAGDQVDQGDLVRHTGHTGQMDHVGHTAQTNETGHANQSDPQQAVQPFDLGPVINSETVTTLANQISYLRALEAYATTFQTNILDGAHTQSAAAHSNMRQTQWMVAATAALALLIALVILGETGVPLLRLSRRAVRIGNGNIDTDPLPFHGPQIIRRMTASMNEMSVTLHGVEEHLARMSSGHVGSSGGTHLPGEIGISMRHSVERLSAVTEQLHRSEQLSSAIIEQAADAIWTIDEHSNVLSANDSSESITGVPADKQLGCPLGDFLGATEGESTVSCADGSLRQVLVSSSVIDADIGQVTTVIAHDISERTRFEAELAYQARHDLLTGLPNRLAAMEHLELLLDESIKFALLFVDIDGFKSVNDTQGHESGDAVLTEVANRLSRSTRATEFVARLGGDEFIVVQTELDHIAGAIALGYRLIEEIELPYDSDRGIFSLSASVGVVQSDSSMTALRALREADSALYLAKQRGRGRVEQFDAALQASIHHEADLTLALRQGIRNEELVLHLQPIVTLDGNTFESAEALVRWNRPGVGLVGPGEFIPIAERSSLIFDIERWVLTTVCERIAAWRNRDPLCDVRVAVNISGRHLIEGDLIADLDIALAVTGADPHMLEFELTESHLLEDLDAATDVLNTLRSRGITIAVDDFGTGYSSMNYLRHFPIDVIKIDRSFVARATEDGYDSTIIEAVLSIARSLQLRVVAEGIETPEQLEYVRSRGCERAQGFLLARPMPFDEAEAMIFATSLTV